MGVRFRHALALALGIVTVVLALGLVAALLTHWFPHAMQWLGVAGGIVLLGVGLNRLGVLQWPSGLGWRARVDPGRGASLGTSYTTGIGLAMGFQVTLLLTLPLIASRPTLGAAVATLVVYAAGFAFAFLAVSLGGVWWARRLGRSDGERLRQIQQIAGALTVAVALLLIIDDGNVLKDLATWKTGPILKHLLG